MTRQFAWTLCAFLLGVSAGSLFIPNIRLTNTIPVNTDFCFLARNPDLFQSRRFITYAHITSVQPHGYVLESPSCPDEILSFTESLDRQDHSQALEEKLRNDWMASVPVLFEGTPYRPSLVRNMFFAARARLGLSGDLNRIITIRAYKAVGEQKWDSKEQNWKPLSVGGGPLTR
jgi:hypothetical protein